MGRLDRFDLYLVYDGRARGGDPDGAWVLTSTYTLEEARVYLERTNQVGAIYGYNRSCGLDRLINETLVERVPAERQPGEPGSWELAVGQPS